MAFTPAAATFDIVRGWAIWGAGHWGAWRDPREIARERTPTLEMFVIGAPSGGMGLSPGGQHVSSRGETAGKHLRSVSLPPSRPPSAKHAAAEPPCGFLGGGEGADRYSSGAQSNRWRISIVRAGWVCKEEGGGRGTAVTGSPSSDHREGRPGQVDLSAYLGRWIL